MQPMQNTHNVVKHYQNIMFIQLGLQTYDQNDNDKYSDQY